jgi:UDP:flavonoid glycosyltransferase YjiC (YdhE family)
MAKIGIVSVGVTGRLHTSCEIGRRLGKRGHELVLASTDPRCAERLRGRSLAFRPLSDGVPAGLREELEQTPPGAARWRLRRVATKARGESALTGHGIEEFLGSEKPDLLLVESELHNTILYLQRLDVPTVLLEYHLSTRRQSGVPPLDSPLIPQGPFAPFRAAAAWRRTLLGRRARQMLDRWYLRPWDPRSVWERLAGAVGKRLREIALEDQWPLLFYPKLRYLHLCASELDFPAAGRGAEVDSFVGPVIQPHRPGGANDPEFESCRGWLRQLDRRRPLVVCASGSILNLPDLAKKMLDAARGADFDLLVAAGRGADLRALGPAPANARLFSFIPQLEALKQASLFVCHGGISSIHESLLAGVPLLVCSAGCMDENGNAARIEYHGLGRRGDKKRDSAAELRRKIERLLRDEQVLDRVQSMQRVLQRYVSDQRLERWIQARL